MGDYLRKSRQDAGFTVQDISSRTNIGSEYIKALENEEYDRIPGDIFVRGYLKEYLRVLSIDPSEAFQLYNRDIKKKAILQATSSSITASSSTATRERLFRRLFVSILLPLIVVLPLIFLLYTKTGNLIDRVMQMVGHVSSAEADYKNQHLLEIRAVENTWISIQIDDNLTYSMLLKPGQKKRWTGDRRFFLKVGNAGGIRITLDGKYLGAPGKRGQVVRFSLPERS